MNDCAKKFMKKFSGITKENFVTIIVGDNGKSSFEIQVQKQ